MEKYLSMSWWGRGLCVVVGGRRYGSLRRSKSWKEAKASRLPRLVSNGEWHFHCVPIEEVESVVLGVFGKERAFPSSLEQKCVCEDYAYFCFFIIRFEIFVWDCFSYRRFCCFFTPLVHLICYLRTLV